MKAGSAWIAGLLASADERDAKPDRRPARRRGREIGERGGGLLARAFERVDPQIERRARRQRRTLRGALVAEGAREMRIEPFGIVAGHPGRRAVEARRLEPRALFVGERRRRMRAPVGKPRDRRGIEIAFEPQHAEHHRARRVGAHDECRGSLAAQRVVGQPGDGGAVAGAGEAVGEAPVLQRIGSRAPPCRDIGQHLDGGGDARGGGHAPELGGTRAPFNRTVGPPPPRARRSGWRRR